MAVKNPVALPALDDLFGVKEDTGDGEKVIMAPLDQLHPFKGHTFDVKDDADMAELVESIKNGRSIEPSIVRPRKAGGYEMITGHRRHRAHTLAEKSEMPIIIRNLTDDEATVDMVDSNLKRESFTYRERVKSIRAKMDALKRQGKRTDLDTSGQNDRKSEETGETREAIAKSLGISASKVQRLYRLGDLIDSLLNLLDEPSIGNQKLNADSAYYLAALPAPEQELVLSVMEAKSSLLNKNQSQRLEQFSKEGTLTQEKIEVILSESKPVSSVSLKANELKQFFDTGTPAEEMKNTIIKALEMYKQSTAI